MKLASIILAAGRSQRMGETNKLLMEFCGKPLSAHVVQEATQLKTSQNLIVTGYENEKVEQALSPYMGENFEFAHNREYTSGMHSSIKVGIENLDDCDAFFIFLADMPYFSHNLIHPLINEAQGLHERKELKSRILAPLYKQQRGHPVLIGSDYLQEILDHADGDFGCSYLFKRYPNQVAYVDCESSNILKDIDTDWDVMKLKNDSQTSDLNFFDICYQMKKENKEFSIATVIDVEGSSSAKIGSKAIIDAEGKNQWGWIGGGCVERFIGDQSVEALHSRSPRSVWADLDDEIFGLGIACGGKMKIFIDPIIHPEKVSFPNLGEFNNELEKLCHLYGVEPHFGEDFQSVDSYKTLLLEVARGMSHARKREAKSLREVKNPHVNFIQQEKIRPSRVVIVGQGRITESLAFHFALCGEKVAVAAPAIRKENFPKNIECLELDEGYENIPFKPNDIVVVASHSARDPAIVDRALVHGASHVSMIGSQKRAEETLDFLKIHDHVEVPLYIPAGLDLGCKNPAEIALSVVAEVIHREVQGAE